METKLLIEATCPDCRGPLSEVRNGDLREFRCTVGHAFSPVALLEAHSEAQERALWMAAVALEEATALIHAVKPEFDPSVWDGLKAQADHKLEQAREIHKILEALEPFKLG